MGKAEIGLLICDVETGVHGSARGFSSAAAGNRQQQQTDAKLNHWAKGDLFHAAKNSGNERLGEKFKGMGLGAAICLRLFTTARVLGLPCFLMGGTLPAAMKFAQRDDDPRRFITAFFYGINIAGAVTGAMQSTCWLLPTLGNKGALTVAVLANLELTWRRAPASAGSFVGLLHR